MAPEQTFENADDAFKAFKAQQAAPAEDEQAEIIEEITEEPEGLELEEEFVEEEADQPQPAIDAPIGYEGVWEDLEPDVQEVIAKQASEANSLITRNSEELTVAKKESVAESQRFTEERQRMGEVLTRLVAVPDEPNSDLIDPGHEDYDPDEFNRQNAVRKRAMNKASEANDELTKINEEKQAEENEALKESHVQRSDYLQKEWPDVLDPVKGPQLQQNIQAYAEGLGMNLEVLPYLTGPMLHALEKARLYEDLQKKGMKKRAPRSVKTSAPSSPGRRRSKKLDQQKEAAIKSGNFKDMLAYTKAARSK